MSVDQQSNLGTNCIKHDSNISTPSRKRWTSTEDDILHSAIEKYGTNWCQVAQSFSNRNPNSCIQRWKRMNGKNVIIIFNRKKQKLQKWSLKEDQLLSKLVGLYGRKWKKISKYFTPKTNKQCMERYNNCLNPNLNKNPFSLEEDQIIYENYLIFGSKWSRIAKCLTKRTHNQVKNRFYTHILSSHLQLVNPYYTKLLPERAKEILIEVRKEHQQKLLQDSLKEQKAHLIQSAFDVDSIQVEQEDDYSNHHRFV
ncbi:unnamed protein product (macronuclear) [Paramecium tetraurelia]|uniref:Myb-like DNA-binding domain containing protein n=1 Tax=Paramecium tetraurelia TaxID=5888 RepID=A0BDR9_PARTE|nr:uncharacterized protein GSPATT00027716001 [Paramecium tetraurelia]CAK56686.1 unnamed protein product [Paramecium tetraurelia]|eukprot:XP_001424084.1 hypothetical protein (macronuclear) [Paramecium tetraurelia strain d4-2]